MSNRNTTASRIIPARPSFLTIYNPSLGDTDESERDQILVWVDRDDDVGKSKRRSQDINPLATNGVAQTDEEGEDDSEEYETKVLDERLRQIGLARGMVEFAKTFSSSQQVDSIETARSRIVLYELEPGWWILAGVDLTKIPSTVPSAAGTTNQSETKKDDSAQQADEMFEYSTREVAPPTLLLANLLCAHKIFLLHHAPTLLELYNRLGRPSFCSILGRYWTKFFRDWDVLLHGNPAVDIYGPTTKLAGGGELGVGVGEEEWGSGEREVLEGFIERTEGLADLIVGRYGQAPGKPPNLDWNVEEWNNSEEIERLTWLGASHDPGPADGVIFSGTGTVSRTALATISQWMGIIFKSGEDAYGVRENPSARPRQRRRIQRSMPPEGHQDVRATGFRTTKHEVDAIETPAKSTQDQSRLRSRKGNKATNLRRQAIENNASPPGIPAPLVSTVERSLDEAVAKVAQNTDSKSPGSSPMSSPQHERSQEEAMEPGIQQDSKPPGRASEESGLFASDKMMKFFTLGYGSSWTMNPKGFQDNKKKSLENPVQSLRTVQDRPPTDSDHAKAPALIRPPVKRQTSKPAEERLQELDPTPEMGDDECSEAFVQPLEQSIGRFLIGLSGDLESAECDDGQDDVLVSGTGRKPSRIYLRTLTVELARSYKRKQRLENQRSTSHESNLSTLSQNNNSNLPVPKTSAAASVDGPAHPTKHHEKLRVAVYVHQPFIFLFLFELHTPSLTIPQFYRDIHHQLGPLQGMLCKRTDPGRIRSRVARLVDEKIVHRGPSRVGNAPENNVIYDLIYDPNKKTIRTSIPNIPLPSSAVPEAVSPKKSITVSGSWYTLGIPLGSPSLSASPSSNSVNEAPRGFDQSAAPVLSRMDMLNVYTQILTAHVAVHAADLEQVTTSQEIERTSKTARGHWVMFMRVPTSSNASTSSILTQTSVDGNAPREAFLIRPASSTDIGSNSKPSRSSGGSFGMTSGRWLLREQARDISGRTAGTMGDVNDDDTAGTNSRGVSEGVGIDARKWVEGLLSLST